MEKSNLDKARTDFDLFLVELGMDRQLVARIASNEADLMPFPPEYEDRLEVRASDIEGLGMFACRALRAGEVIAPGRIGWQRTPAGRYINHSPQPNAEGFVLSNGRGDLYVRALCDIASGEEVLLDYRQMAAVNREAMVLVQQMSKRGKP